MMWKRITVTATLAGETREFRLTIDDFSGAITYRRALDQLYLIPGGMLWIIESIKYPVSE